MLRIKHCQFINNTFSNIIQADGKNKQKIRHISVSYTHLGIGFPDINTLEPLANALDISVFELMRSEKADMGKDCLLYTSQGQQDCFL